MTVTTVDIQRIAEDVLTSVGDCEAVPAGREAAHDAHTTLVIGQVQITGCWAGSVVVALAERLAQRVTENMLGMSADELAPGDVHDVVGELANMIGGNLKGLLGVGCALSLPSVVEGRDMLLSLPGTHEVDRVALATDAGLCVVTVCASDA